MFRLIIALILFLTALGALGYLLVLWLSKPRRRLLREFRRMRKLVVEGVDESQRMHVDQLLEDCEAHLQGLIRARERLDVLSNMADAASELTDVDESFDREAMEEQIRDDVSYFLSEMGRISAEVDYDWRESIERLEALADELEEEHRVFAQLEEEIPREHPAD